MNRILLEEWDGMAGWDDRLHVTFQENVCTIAQSSKKIYKAFHFSSIFYCFFVAPSLEVIQKMTSSKKGRREGGSNKSVTRLRFFLEVSVKFENTNNLLFTVFLLCIRLESISHREEHRPFCELL